MKKNNIKKRLLILIIIITIIILTIACLLLIKSTASNSEAVGEYENLYYEIEEYVSDKIIPRNALELNKYRGEYSKSDLYVSFCEFVEYLSYINKNCTSENISEFYKDKSEQIEEKIGITTEKDFEAIFNIIKEKNVDINEFSYAEVEKNSTYTSGRYFYCNVKFNYGEDEVIFKVGLATHEVLSKPIVYSVK